MALPVVNDLGVALEAHVDVGVLDPLAAARRPHGRFGAATFMAVDERDELAPLVLFVLLGNLLRRLVLKAVPALAGRTRTVLEQDLGAVGAARSSSARTRPSSPSHAALASSVASVDLFS